MRLKSIIKKIRPFWWYSLSLAVAAVIVLCLPGGTWLDAYRALGLRRAPDEEPRVIVLDVGQGSATLFVGAGQVCLLDCGDEAAGKTVVSAVRDLGLDRLSLVLVSHPHSDHIGGLPTVLRELTVERIAAPDWTPENEAEQSLWQRVQQRADEVGCDTLTLATGTQVTAAGFTFDVLACLAQAEDENDRSAIVSATCGTHRVLCMGDTGITAERTLLSSARVKTCDALIAGHHGSVQSTGDAWLSAVKPTYVIVSCGLGNAYGHPSDAFLSRVAAAGTRLLRTDLNGTVTLRLNEGAVTFEHGEVTES